MGRQRGNAGDQSGNGNQQRVYHEQDIRSLAIEIATLTKRQQHGKGLRMA